MTDGSPDAGLPQAARDRTVQIQDNGTWGSTLSTDEFAAIRGVGFEPAGQVFGACVYNIGYVGASGCAGEGGWSGSDSGPAGALTRVSGQGGFGVRPLVQALYEARHTAIGRMTAQCAALGGHGTVSVSLTVGEFPFSGQKFQAIGTAVRGAVSDLAIWSSLSALSSRPDPSRARAGSAFSCVAPVLGLRG